jgi:hypothetical protein
MGTSTKDYSQLTFSSIYSHTDVFADPLGESMVSLGPDAMDRILLESMHNYTSFMTMPQAANWILLADTVLNGGQNAALLHLNFAARNILSPQIGLKEPTTVDAPRSFLMQGQADWEFQSQAGRLFNLAGQKVAEWGPEAPTVPHPLPAGRYFGVWENGEVFHVVVVAQN